MRCAARVFNPFRTLKPSEKILSFSLIFSLQPHHCSTKTCPGSFYFSDSPHPWRHSIDDCRTKVSCHLWFLRMESQSKDSLLNHDETSEQSCEQLDSEGEQEEEEEEEQDTLNLALQTGGANPVPLNAKVFGGEPPEVGMVFDSENQAYDYYNAYGRFLGFSIRKSKMVIRKDKTVTRRVFCCSKEGFRCKHPRGDPMRPRPVTRTGCKARLGIQLQDDGKYSINEFVEEHNHMLAPPSETHMLRSQRKIDPQAGGIGSIDSIISFIREEAGGSPNLNQGDCSNYVQRWCYEILKRAEEDKKRIRELSAELHRERRQCATYREKLHMVLKDMEDHTHHLSKQVENVVDNMKDLESRGSKRHS